MTLQTELMEMQDQITTLREENAALKRTQVLSENLGFDATLGWYFRNLEQGRDGPFCPTCWDDRKKLIRPVTASLTNVATCNVCHRTGYVVSPHPPR